METIGSLIIGLFCIVSGIVNLTGNTSLLHSYHRKNVSEEDQLAFAKKMGIGSIIMGIALLLLCGSSFLADRLQNTTIALIGNILFIIVMAVGAIISLAAIKKYNKSIF